eukprot:m.115501 g.115501  ORF g.115501 m.115501 type:complete len:139 (-) comp22988_c1_seq3:1431-1847(-)
MGLALQQHQKHHKPRHKPSFSFVSGSWAPSCLLSLDCAFDLCALITSQNAFSATSMGFSSSSSAGGGALALCALFLVVLFKFNSLNLDAKIFSRLVSRSSIADRAGFSPCCMSDSEEDNCNRVTAPSLEPQASKLPCS